MGCNFKARHSAALSVLLPAASIFIWPAHLWIYIIFIIWATAAAWFWIYSERKQHKRSMTEAILQAQSTTVGILNHHRHDWMNDLQVLFGYAKMQKIDRLLEYMEKVKDKMTAESGIAKLGVPALVYYLQSFRTLTNMVELNVIIDGPIHLNELELDAKRTSNLLIGIMDAYRIFVKPEYMYNAQLDLHLYKDEQKLYASFHYDGELSNEEEWKKTIEKLLQDTAMQTTGSIVECQDLLLAVELAV